jgi:hypothetical protein
MTGKAHGPRDLREGPWAVSSGGSMPGGSKIIGGSIHLSLINCLFMKYSVDGSKKIPINIIYCENNIKIIIKPLIECP